MEQGTYRLNTRGGGCRFAVAEAIICFADLALAQIAHGNREEASGRASVSTCWQLVRWIKNRRMKKALMVDCDASQVA
jgi:hypothetical protein